MSDFCVMTQQASIFTAGPPVVKQSIGEDVSKEDLGGPTVAITSGLVHNLTGDDAEALAQIRRYLSYFPSSAWGYATRRPEDETALPRLTPELVDLVPRDNRRLYDMRRAIDAIVDTKDWLEIQPTFGTAMICALAHLGGHPIAIVANQPKVMAGSIDAKAADKAARFITVADSFHLPLVFLADNPGMMPGTRSEQAGVLRSGARMYAAQSMVTSPKLEVTFRKAYGFGSMVMAMAPFDSQTGTFAFPGATMGAMGAGAMGSAINADADQAESLRRAELTASYRSAEGLGFDELIDPRQTRNALLDALTRGLWARQEPAAPVSRIGVLP
jgi:acetyl-CoA carboxylase carboxyltransferase component